ncbi:CMRF35-like molecule 9 isoform X2 [Equus przewalskii]|uniref:CMRF35-like molecule 9 isoform X2 n=2 Tax=Equus przewalskii TaxID=9798 RepID=A0ABM2FJE7_EQUPR|nr:PREDICTED: CMRF35-like molecule 9 isoform X2 [Equus przewalskii]XP_014595357.1 CMRF35-like molecule 9 isoform X2 [Equus caballus]
MRPLVLLWGCLVLPGYGVLVGPKEISGFEGDTLSLQCTYGEELKKHKKYWCREGGLLISRCSGTIYAEEDGQERTAGRVSVWDSPEELTLTVTLRNLTLQDAGKYWCGVSRLGFDWSFLVSLRVLPGPCCLPSPTPSFQPLATRSLQPKAKTWQTQPPELITTAKQKTGAEASPFTGTSASRHTQASPYAGTAPYAGTSPHAVTSPFTGTPPHEATSPHAGTSRPATQLDSTSAETSLVPSSRSSKSRVSIPMVRILAPVLVLLSLLLTAGLAALSRYLLRRRKEAQLAAETQRMEKVHLPHSPLENCWVQECAKINTAGPAGPRASPQPSSSPCRDIGCLSQTSEEAEASSRDPEGATIPGPPLHLSEEELDFSKFISV